VTLLNRYSTSGGAAAPRRAQALLLRAREDQLAGRLREAAEGFAAELFARWPRDGVDLLDWHRA